LYKDNRIKEIFTFTGGERKGITVLLIILSIVILLNLFTDRIFGNREENFQSFKNEISKFEESLKKKEQSVYSNSCLFYFNPNHATTNELQKLGLKDRQIQTIQNYLKKGGSFRKKSDFRKIFGISEQDYNRLEPYIDLPESENRKIIPGINGYDKTSFNVDYFEFDPNEASDAEWIKLGFSEKQTKVIRTYIENGGLFFKKEDLKELYVISDKKYQEIEKYVKIDIDKVKIKENSRIFSYRRFEPNSIDINSIDKQTIEGFGGKWEYLGNRIVKYRELLGGFYSKEQLMEVYGFDRAFYDEVKGFIKIDNQRIKRFNINFSEVNELERHPYFSKETAKKIITYRNVRGAYKAIEELYSNNVVDSEIYNKIKYYISVE
jgi:DNA uptake protein ComE-like DNA-binding protein